MRSRWIALFSVFAALTVLPACQGEPAEEEVVEEEAPAEGPVEEPAQEAEIDPAALPEGVTPEMVTQGRQIFTGQGLCQTCHGPDATGTQLAPNLTDQEWLNIDGSYDAIVNLVQTGVAQPVQYPAPMPPMGGASLTEDQVRAVAAYVYALSHGG